MKLFIFYDYVRPATSSSLTHASQQQSCIGVKVGVALIFCAPHTLCAECVLVGRGMACCGGGGWLLAVTLAEERANSISLSFFGVCVS